MRDMSKDRETSLDAMRNRRVITDEFARRLREVGRNLPPGISLESLKPNAPIGIRLEGDLGENWRGAFRHGGQVKQFNRGLNSFRKKTKGSTVGDLRNTELEQMPPGLVARLLKKVF